ncbi:FAD-dependent monooxygenase [Streptomyces sp. NPDC059740]|uniref:FAD-dependent monooxygenase n=1 Tax=Streptomyces sp. NPDC059740 TaxID=3346926 RepID=UPI003647651D
MSGAAQVLVVGAGPTGLTLACDLLRRGVGVLLVERAAALFPGSRGKGLQPRTQEVFDDLGVMAALTAAGGPFPPMVAWEDGVRGEEWELLGEAAGAPESAYPRAWMVPQWRTQAVLGDRLRELGGEVAFGTELVGLCEPDGDTAPLTARLRGPDGRTRTVTARYVVGADGGHSTVRRLAGVEMTGAPVDATTTLIADLEVPRLDRANWHVWPKAPGGSLLLCPLPGTREFQLSAHFREGAPQAGDEAVRRLVAERTHLPADAVTRVRCASHYRPRVALAERYRVGRVLLAGDAAHIHPPGGGQGLNTGVQDAYNLGWKLGQVLRHGAPEDLLDSYEEERMPVAAEVLDLSTRLYRAGRVPQTGNEDEAGRRRRTVHQLSLHYRGRRLSVDARAERGPGLRAGDRAADGACGTGRLHELLRGPQFTLLTVGGAPGRVPPGVAAHEVTSAALRETYGEGLFLVRPDGYVGLATDDHADVLGYLAGMGVA